MVERGWLPYRRVVADGAVVWEVLRDVIRIGTAVENGQVAGVAVSRCVGELPVRMA
jgi:hypothetical protein